MEQPANTLAPVDPSVYREVLGHYPTGVTHGVLASQGGAVTDPNGRVLDAAGFAIPGLLSAFGLGWIIGNGLAAADHTCTAHARA